MIFAMLGKYKQTHLKSGLESLADEIELSTTRFLGYVDSVMVDKEGGWWIVDMKTAASFSQIIVPTLAHHPQLVLYSHHKSLIAAKLGLKLEDFRGCRYRLTTKTKLQHKDGEPISGYVKRCSLAIKSLDFIIPAAMVSDDGIITAHQMAVEHISRTQIRHSYACNYDSCTQWYRPCEYFSRCHGKEFSQYNLEVIDGDQN
jgi:hypothetical protein